MKEKVNQSESQPARPGSVKSSPPIMSVCISQHTNILMKRFMVQNRSYVKNARLIVLSGPMFHIEEMFLWIAHFLEFQFELSCIDFFIT